MKLKGLSPVAYRTQSFRIIAIMLNEANLFKNLFDLSNFNNS